MTANSSQLPSNRSFGTLFVVIFALASAFGWWHGSSWHFWTAGVSAALLVITAFLPGILAPFNRMWMKLAEVLHKVVSPVVLGAMFFAVITPVGIFMRLIGRDALKRKFDPSLESYWIVRQPAGPQPEDLPNQF